MITLLTGLPGHGKSYYITEQLLKAMKEGGTDRRYFQFGVRGLDLPGVETFEPEKWFELPEKSFFVIDEAQQVFPTAAPGTPKPKKITEFETHRHKGFDCIIATQQASQIHHHLRGLAGEHIHVHRPLGMGFANVWRFERACDPNDYHNKQAATKSLMRFSPDIWNHYHSATHHTVKRKLPIRLLLIPVLLVALVFTVVWGVKFFTGQKKTVDQNGNIVASGSTSSIFPSGMHTPGAAKAIASPLDYIRQYQPRVASVLASAPRYDDLNKPVEAPKISACIATVTRCVCYTQQATVYRVPESVCRSFADIGSFDDTRSSLPNGFNPVSATQSAPPVSVTTPAGVLASSASK